MNKRYLVKEAQSDLPTRHKQDNKTRGGKCLIVAGSPGQWGAGILCARAAARSGAGYTFVYDPKSKFPIHSHPDFLIIRQLKNLSQFSAVAIGPGFHNPRLIQNLLRQLFLLPTINVVLDAEALNTLAQMKKKITLPKHWIMTPHEGELSRLMNVSSLEIKRHRQKYIEQAQKKWGGIVVLKGYKTLIADGIKTWEITAGNPALAKAGTGDVLTGIMAAFLSQKLSPRKAACLAAFIHGKCADLWVQSGKDQLSLMASDLIEEIPFILNQVRKTNS